MPAANPDHPAFPTLAPFPVHCSQCHAAHPFPGFHRCPKADADAGSGSLAADLRAEAEADRGRAERDVIDRGAGQDMRPAG